MAKARLSQRAQVTRTILFNLFGSPQICLNPILASCLFRTLWNYAQVDLIDLLIARTRVSVSLKNAL